MLRTGSVRTHHPPSNNPRKRPRTPGRFSAQFGAPGLSLPISGTAEYVLRASARSLAKIKTRHSFFELVSVPSRTLYLMKPSSRRLRILLVENHEDTLTYLTRYLEQQGHEVCGVRDMASALKAICYSSSFDVLISDIGLPDGDGWQLIRQMKPKPFGIAMSGFGARFRLRKEPCCGLQASLDEAISPGRSRRPLKGGRLASYGKGLAECRARGARAARRDAQREVARISQSSSLPGLTCNAGIPSEKYLRKDK